MLEPSQSKIMEHLFYFLMWLVICLQICVNNLKYKKGKGENSLLPDELMSLKFL